MKLPQSLRDHCRHPLSRAPLCRPLSIPSLTLIPVPAVTDRLLEDSLGNGSKCVMVVNVSPAADNAPETKCSLEFASRARKVGLKGG